MATYSDITEKYVTIFTPENASEDLKLDIERAREAAGTEIAASSATVYLHFWRPFKSYFAKNQLQGSSS